MALPTRDQVLTGEYSGYGSPYIQVAAKSGIDLDTLEYSEYGSPFYGVEVAATSAGISKVGGVLWTNLSKIGGVLKANINKLLGIDP